MAHDHIHMLVLLPLFLFSFSWLATALTYHGADISSLTVVEHSGVSYKDSGQTLPFETILKNHGMNAARVRIWTAGQYNLQYGLALGKRIKAAGMTLIVDLHFSDTCACFSLTCNVFETDCSANLVGADPGHQAIPSGWPTDLSGLNTEIYTYVGTNPLHSPP